MAFKINNYYKAFSPKFLILQSVPWAILYHLREDPIVLMGWMMYFMEALKTGDVMYEYYDVSVEGVTQGRLRRWWWW